MAAAVSFSRWLPGLPRTRALVVEVNGYGVILRDFLVDLREILVQKMCHGVHGEFGIATRKMVVRDLGCMGTWNVSYQAE